MIGLNTGDRIFPAETVASRPVMDLLTTPHDLYALGAQPRFRGR